MINKSPLKEIEIIELFGKYNFKIILKDLVNILIAENGSGKTTVLNIITSVLKADIYNLRKYPFKTVIVKFNNSSKIAINKSELDFPIDDDFKYIISKYRRYLSRYDMDRLMSVRDYNDPALEHILYNFPNSVRVELKELLSRRFDYNENNSKKVFSQKLEQIRDVFNSKVLYLPTFRRIEEELENLGLSEERNLDLSSKMINFGMNDVEQEITELTDKIKKEAIVEYSRMSRQILHDLLNLKVNVTNFEEKKINKDILEIILGRIGEEHIRSSERILGFVESNKKDFMSDFLKYYLVKLINIYESQREIDNKIKQFKNICNQYLVNKQLVYNEVLAEVTIEDGFTEKELKFKNLSSGEKQIISLFAKLYLEDKNDLIFIIDEPELSLSLPWQRRLLPDVVNSGKCSLLIATTHSPFIYDNDFFDFAGDLSSLFISNIAKED